MADKLGINVDKEKFDAMVGEGFCNGEKIILVKPQTYMNLSGESVCQIVNYYKLEINDLIVIYDDIDLELGNIRIKPQGGMGTHNGMRNIYAMLGDSAFPRIRIGTGKVYKGIELKDFVLMKMTKEETNVMRNVMENVYNAMIILLKEGIEKAMSTFNGKNEG